MEVLLSAARDDMRLTGQLSNHVTVPLANMVGQDEAYKQDLLPSPNVICSKPHTWNRESTSVRVA